MTNVGNSGFAAIHSIYEALSFILIVEHYLKVVIE